MLFDTRTLEPTGPALRAHTARVNDVSYAHSGRLLVSASEDRTAIVWEVTSGDPLHRFVGRDRLRNAAFGADDRTVYATGGDGLILAWGVNGISRLLTLGESAQARVEQVDGESLPAPDGHTVARVRAGRLWFEDVTSGSSTPQVPNYDTGFTWSPDARWFVSTDPRGVVRVWDAAPGAPVAEDCRGEVGAGAGRVQPGQRHGLRQLGLHVEDPRAGSPCDRRTTTSSSTTCRRRFCLIPSTGR